MPYVYHKDENEGKPLYTTVLKHEYMDSCDKLESIENPMLLLELCCYAFAILWCVYFIKMNTFKVYRVSYMVVFIIGMYGIQIHLHDAYYNYCPFASESEPASVYFVAFLDWTCRFIV